MGVKHSEVELAELVISYLEDMGWDVYQEVQLFSFGKRADIVAKKGSITWVIETKMGAGLEVIGQAHGWKYFANYVSIAIPRSNGSRTFPMAKAVCKKFGIGVLQCQFEGTRHNVTSIVSPSLDRKPYGALLRCLSEKHKTFAKAGNSESEFWSPFKQTCNDLRGYIKANPGATLKELVENVQHHYSSDGTARSSIVQWVRLGKIKGLSLDSSCRPMRIYPEIKAQKEAVAV